MATDSTINTERVKNRLVESFLVCFIAVVMNVVGAQLVSALNLPIYLDSVGTIVASMLGGYLPGILVGYFTNLVLGFFHNETLYYAILNVLVALVTAFFAHRKKPQSPILKWACIVVVLSIMCGSMTTLIEWGLVGLEPNWFQADQLIANLRNDFLDKLVSVAMGLLIGYALPQRVSELFAMTLWQQTPLTSEEAASLSNVDSRVMPLRVKIIGIVCMLMVAVALVTTWISYLMFNDSMVAEQAAKAQGITNLMIANIDASRVDDYLDKGEQAEGYLETERALSDIRNSFDGVQYVYVYRILEDGCHVVLDPDTEEEMGSDPGSVIEFDEAFMPHLNELLAGRPIDPIVSNEKYGWLLTVYQPIYDENGRCVCYAAVDLLMDHILNDGCAFIARVIALFAAFLILVCAGILWLAQYGIILPLNSIARATSGFAFNTEDDREETIAHVRDLNVSSGDEIENLYQSVLKTAEDTVEYIAESEEKGRTIERMQDNLIMVMADLVESRDQFTGDHVRKTAAYTAIIMEQMREEGSYVDQLTDKFVHDVVRSAPLHDIGKIVVSDTVLNKPGRLTDEEFESMKRHTTAGREIIDRAVGAVSEPTYLDEAKNLAEFHHEKWAGGGYPTGISGEDIPLSARIMAVADVFDALVSKRSYKKGFPFDKAFAIIEEGIGTHFDPKVATAFLHVRKKAERIARSYGDGDE